MDYLRDFIYSCDYNVNKMLAEAYHEEAKRNLQKPHCNAD